MDRDNSLLLGVVVYALALWVMVMVIFFAFSAMLTRDPDYCAARLEIYEYVLPARPLACFLAAAMGIADQPGDR